jgi:hypothetical protein
MKKKNGLVWAGIGLTLMMVFSACGSPSPEATPTSTSAPTSSPLPTPEEAMATEEPTAIPDESATSPLPTPAPEMTSPLETPTAVAEDEGQEQDEVEEALVWMADGIITEDEYTDQADFGDMRIWWMHDGEFLYLAMEGDTTGWVSVGINPQNGMQGANYLFGYVENGEALIWDAYGTAPTGANHPPDEDLDGTNDIVTFSGVEEDGVTRFEVQIPLDSGDEYDQPLEPGNSYPIIIAIGDADDFNGYHRRYDRGELTLAP